jgi:chromosome partitioning protein
LVAFIGACLTVQAIMMRRIIAVANQKGGVGKTTTCVNLAASLATINRRVLLIDLDPQGNATMGCGVDKASVKDSACDLLLEKTRGSEIVRTLHEFGFDLLPGNSDLTAADVSLMEASRRERRLANALVSFQNPYDYILIDCPPSLNLLTLNALVAANSLLIPMQCEYYALEGLSGLMETLANVRATVNPGLRLEGLLRTMHDPRSRLTRDVSEQLIRYFGDSVFRTFIPRNIRLAEAPSHGLPVIQYDRSSRGAAAYLALADEIAEKERHRVGGGCA